MEDIHNLHVELVEKELVNVDLIEKDLVRVDLNVVDLIPRIKNLADLLDVNLESLQDNHLIKYSSVTEKWENRSLSEVIESSAIYNESPTKIGVRKFQTSNNYVSGTLQVFLNGIKEKYIIEEASNQFSFEIDIGSNEIVEVSYIKA